VPPSWIPAAPPSSPEQRGRTTVRFRFEDVAQDGHVVLEAIPQSLGASWRRIAARGAVDFGPGVVAILSRVVIEGGEGPVSVSADAEAEGFYHLAHTPAADGSPDRLVLAMWVDLHAPLGRTHPPPPPDAGRPLVAGRIFAEHVFTRPFAPPADRRVRAIQLGGGPPFVPEAPYAWRDPDAILDLPEGATPLDPAPVPDETLTVLGLDHTDSNQHVNSLVYTRLFIEAALRRFHGLGEARTGRLARAIEIAYRRPSFAGERVRVASRAFRLGERLGVTAAVAAEGEAPGARPRCVARLLFGEG
jgi:hypothetical protein